MKHSLLLRLTVIVVVYGLGLCAHELPAQEEVNTLAVSEVTRDYCEVTRLCGVYASSTVEKVLPEALFDNYERQLTSIKGIRANVEIAQTIYEFGSGNFCLAKKSVNVARWYVDFTNQRFRVTEFNYRDRKSYDRDGACDATQCGLVIKRQDGRSYRYSASITGPTDVDTRTAILLNNDTFEWLTFLQLHRRGPLLANVPGEGLIAVWKHSAPDARKTAKFSLVGTDNLPSFGKCYVVKVEWKSTDWKGGEVKNYQAWLWFTPASQPIRSVEVIDYSDGAKSVVVAEVKRLASLGGVSIPISAQEALYQSTNNPGTKASSFPLRTLLVTESALSQVELNPRWNKKDFVISLPPKTLVHDGRTNRIYITPAISGFPGGLLYLILTIVIAVLVLVYIWRRLHTRLGS